MKSPEGKKRAISNKIITHFISFSFHCDSVKEYAVQVMSPGHFYLELSDAIKEGDGKHLLRCWQYLLPVFWSTVVIYKIQATSCC